MMNTGAPDCFAATNVAVGISFVPFYAMEACAIVHQTGKSQLQEHRCLHQLDLHPVSSPNYMTLVRGREGTNTEVGMDFMTNLGPLEFSEKIPLRGPSHLQPMVLYDLPVIAFVVYCK